MKTEHTPASEWSAVSQGYTRHGQSQMKHLTIFAAGDEIRVYGANRGHNARVIAASAAMFEALITCVNKLHEKTWPDCDYEFDGPSAEFICEGCAAIAQAKGEKINQARRA